MNLIKAVLEQQGRSQTWLAKQIGKSYVVTTNYCNNKAQPSIPVLVKIAGALQIDIRELVESTRNGAGKPDTKATPKQ